MASRYSDSPRARRSADPIPVECQICRTCPDRPWGPRSLLYNGRRVRRSGRGVNHPAPSDVEVTWSVKLYCYTPSGPSWIVLRLSLPLLTLRTRYDFNATVYYNNNNYLNDSDNRRLAKTYRQNEKYCSTKHNPPSRETPS
jgi:hypothetical protein